MLRAAAAANESGWDSAGLVLNDMFFGLLGFIMGVWSYREYLLFKKRKENDGD